jgi:hypothetical protein
MSYQDHLKTCSYCQKEKGSLTQASASNPKPTISIKSASSYRKQKKLSELGAIIKGTSTRLDTMQQTKGASVVRNNPRKPGPIERG